MSRFGTTKAARLAMKMKFAAAILAIGTLLLAGAAGRAVATAPQPVWSEVPWPFPMDQWGKGKAFWCKAADCGIEVTVYIRAKVGFCNCTTGVADDDELDRVSDFDLIGDRLAAQGPGRPVGIAGIKGRSRAFIIAGARGTRKSALSVGFNHRCDAVIATAVLAPDRAAAAEQAVLDFLNGETIQRWVETTLGS